MVAKIKENIGWVQVLTIIVATFGMFLWGQRESRAEIRSIRAEGAKFRSEINKITRDFHGRLCTTEEKYYQLDRKK